MAKRRLPTCPHPKKIPHRTVRDAGYAARQFARKLNAEGKIAEPLYVHPCRAGHFHLTRMGTYQGRVNELVLCVPLELQRWAMPKTPERTT